MKKKLFIAGLICLTMVSCKKDYVCECTLSGSGGGVTINGLVVETTTIKDTKKKAKDKCTAKNETDGGFNTTCVIK